MRSIMRLRRYYETNAGRIINGAVVFFAIFYALLSVAQGCSSRSTPKPKQTGPTPRPNITFHTYACPPMYNTWYCLNGATCFTVKIGEHLLYNCECSDGYIGPRCEYKDLDSSYYWSRNQVLLVPAGIAFAVLLAVLLIIIIIAYLYLKQKREKQKLAEWSYVDGAFKDKPFSRVFKV